MDPAGRDLTWTFQRGTSGHAIVRPRDLDERSWTNSIVQALRTIVIDNAEANPLLPQVLVSGHDTGEIIVSLNDPENITGNVMLSTRPMGTHVFAPDNDGYTTAQIADTLTSIVRSLHRHHLRLL